MSSLSLASAVSAFGAACKAKLDEYTVDLMNLLHVLGRLVRLEPAQADLLERICAAPLLPFALPDPQADVD